MAQLGNVNIDGLDLSAAMRNDLSGGMSVSQFNSKYSSSVPGFRPIGAQRQVGAAAPAPAPAAAAGAAPSSSEAGWNQQLQNFTNQQSSQFQALLDRQNGQQQGLFDQYTQKLGSQEQLPALYQRLQQEQGIGDISAQIQPFKDEIFRVKGLLDRLPEDITSRNTGTYATQALRDRILASEGEDMRNTLGRLGTGMEPLTEQLTAAQNQVSTMMPLYMQQQQREMQPLELQINSLSDRFAREMTGFSSDRELQLTTLMDSINRGRQLSDRDWQLAQDIAAEERAFARQKQLASQNMQQYLPQNNVPSSASSIPRQLPMLPGISIQSNPSSGMILQPSSSGLKLQGSSGVSLQGGSGLNLQGGSIRLQ